ncbi:6057_t:CDS:2, partial [Acaulospora colombiana]
MLDGVKDEIYVVLQDYKDGKNINQNAKKKVDKLLSTYNKSFMTVEVLRFKDKLRWKAEEEEQKAALRMKAASACTVEDLEGISNLCMQIQILSLLKRVGREVHGLDSDDENGISEQFEVELKNVADGDKFGEWILSTGKNDYINSQCIHIAHYFFDSPAFFGILDLSGDDTEVKEFFTDEKWCEMRSDFSKTVTFQGIDEQEEKLLYNLFDDVEKGILTYQQKLVYDEGEVQSLASALIANSSKKPTDRSLIGQKCEFRVAADGFEAIVGLRSGGLPEACKAKKWDDKVDLMLPQSNGQLLMIEKLVTTLLRLHTSKVSGTIWLSKPQDYIETGAVQSFLINMRFAKKDAYDEYVLKNILKGKKE